MNRTRMILCGLCLSSTVFAVSGKAYMERFQTYLQWSQNLPVAASIEFLTFIDSETPLAQKLREKWLYQLARNKDWVNYTKHYQPSTDINLQCFALVAQYNQGRQQQALEATKPLWLAGHSQPPACNALFNFLLASGELDETLISKRIGLALEERNLSLARHLLKQYKKPRQQDAKILTDIYLNPGHVAQLEPGPLHDQFYLYGLKSMVPININRAIDQWEQVKTKKFLSDAQNQSFLSSVALYKAMRNIPDAPLWFSKIKPAFYTEALLDWRIRFALKQQQWPTVEALINHSPDKENPCWQYWLARSIEAQGQREKAHEIYQKIAKTRNYYGFLASLRLHQKLSFENEKAVSDMKILQPYQPFTDQIKALYASKQELQASRLLNDFVLELPKKDKSALAYWLSHELQWHGKSIYISSIPELNNQLALRFPLAYRSSVNQYAQNYRIPQEFVYAIIRQESTFRDDVISPAGAHGLMQIMPATAKATAKYERINYADKKQLFGAQKNINIGVAYLKQLANRFDRHPILMAAAYNAGPRQVVYWLKNHPPKQIDIWIETLPWRETRNYLKNIVSFYAVYQHRMNQKADLSDFMRPFRNQTKYWEFIDASKH